MIWQESIRVGRCTIHWDIDRWVGWTHDDRLVGEWDSVLAAIAACEKVG